jgi:methylmalonyl-CoA mutase, N-terminal domain
LSEQEKKEKTGRDEKAWQEKVNKSLEKHPERKNFKLDSDLELETVYDPLNMENFDYQEQLSWPGEYPYTRGIQPNMYRGRHWTMRQYAGFGSAEETNERFRYLLDQGQTGLKCRF